MVRNTDFIGFTFNGRHSSEFNIYSVSDGSRYQDNLVPNPVDYTEQIPGGVGQYYFGSDMDIKEFPLSIAYDKLTEEKLRELRTWLAPDTVGELIFDERPYKTYTAKISTSPSLSFICFDKYNKESGRKERIYKGEGSINFVCYYPLGITSGEKKNLGWYREQIDDKIYRNIGGSSSIINYKLENKEIAVLEKIKGKTYQKTSKQGKNLVNISDKILTNQIVNGYSGISDKNLLSILDKTKTYIYSAQIDNTLGTTYSVISLWAVRNDVNERLQTLPTVRIAAGQTGISTVTLNGATFDWTGITALYCGVSINANGENVTITVKRFQFEEGSAATSYEPFVPDSPSPDYPSEIIGVQPSSVRVCRKNLLPPVIGTDTYVGITAAAGVDGVNISGKTTNVCMFKLSGSMAHAGSSNQSKQWGINGNFLPAGTYTISVVFSGSVDRTDSTDPSAYAYPLISVLYKDGTSTLVRHTEITKTINTDKAIGAIALCLGTGGIAYSNFNAKVQIEAGDAATPFEPYAGTDYPLTLTTPMYSLPGGADEIDLVSGAETRRCRVITLDGTETWMVRKANATSVSFVLTPGGAIPGIAIGSAVPALSDIGFRASRYSIDGYEGMTADSGVSRRPQISVLYSRIGSSAEDTDEDKISKFKVWLAAHPVTMVCSLAEPATVAHARTDVAQPAPEANVSADGAPVTVVYQLAEPVITTKGKMSQLGIEVISDLEESNLIVNSDSEKTNYFTNSNAGLSLRIYPQKYQNIDEWDLSSGLLETLDTKNPTAGYDHYITLPDNTKGIQLFNPGDKETDFILSFNKPTPMNDIFFTLSNGEQFILNLRSSDTDVEDYGAVSDAEKRVAAMTGGVITIDTKKNRIMYKYGTGENVTEESIYFALKKGQFFKIPKNKTSTGGYNLVIGTTSNIETDSIKISYDYLYY